MKNYILVLSHDEVVHLKCSMINKMPGLGFDKFANLKAGYAFMMGHPGKKLLFMGQEFAQLREWSEKREIDWFLLAEPEHRDIQNWYRDLLHLYKNNKALYEMSLEREEFQGMGCTLVAAVIEDGVLYAANIGDSRLYLIHDGSIRQITRDHSYVEEMVAMGMMQRGSADYKPEKEHLRYPGSRHPS